MLTKLIILCSVFLAAMGVFYQPIRYDKDTSVEGFGLNQELLITGKIPYIEHGNVAFTVALVGKNGDYEFYMNVRKYYNGWSNYIILNVIKNGNWGTHWWDWYTIEYDKEFKIVIQPTETTYKVTIDGNYVGEHARFDNLHHEQKIRIQGHIDVKRVTRYLVHWSRSYPSGLLDNHKIVMETNKFTSSRIAIFGIGTICFGIKPDLECAVSFNFECESLRYKAFSLCNGTLRLDLIPGSTPKYVEVDNVIMSNTYATFELRRNGTEYKLVWLYKNNTKSVSFPFQTEHAITAVSIRSFLRIYSIKMVVNEESKVIAPIFKRNDYGCYLDLSFWRILGGAAYSNDNNNTRVNCANSCKLGGFKLAGLEFGKECFCGNEIRYRLFKIVDDICELMKCSGNSDDFCGGPQKIWIYSLDDFGCYSDKNSDRVLTDAVYHSKNNNTKDNCANSCKLGGYKYSGVEYGEECYCGNEIRLKTNKISDELCNDMKCPGNSNDFCGGPHKIWISVN